MRNFRILLPPLPEQRAIAHILGSLDDKIELNRQMNKTLEAMARAIFKSWFVDFDPVRAKAEGRPTGLPDDIAALFPDSFENSEFGEIPKGWEVKPIGSEFNLTMGQSPPGNTYNEIGNGLPFFQGRRDFSFRYPSKRVYCTAPQRLADQGDTLVSVRAPVGDINMAMERCCVGRGVAAVRHKSGSRSYTYYAMNTLSNRFARFDAEGTVFGAINKRQFEELSWLTPGEKLVSEFEKIASTFDEQIEKNTNENKTLIALRDTLLPKLISGELRVPDAEKFVEDAGV
jgi:type I restriction enzyme S subunit